MVRRVSEVDELNSFIGNKIAEYRIVSGMTRQELAELIFVTHQQLQKYEKGVNRVSAGRLGLISQALERSIGDFYAGFGDYQFEDQSEHKRMKLEVSKNFTKINPVHQDAVNSLIRILANSDSE